MADLVRVRLDGVEKNVGREFADAYDLEVLDESPYRGDGQLRPTTRKGGRPRKPKTTVADQAAAKKAAAVAADDTAKEA
ncbi:hypothetical protein LRP67_16240 [Nocardioides sp. cx-169]|uniref:hypothetical protein n=1 Tax=Nocardioides sp. cx-169 TaxID=2899080 RepID=UPI001E6120BA|nr:hypothetical protein [Nocardioides sp. cx-169]MCD4535643.1 hypothetical protein [Nocardioides sp. cx-169]